MSTDRALRVVATESAAAELERLKAEHGPLELHLSGGCCDGSSPMCFPAGELRRGQADLLLGEVAGCAFFLDAEQDRRWGSPSFVLDVGPGAGSGFSLEGLDELHFIARTTVPTQVSSARKLSAAL
jgi:uncharacterized protein (DUF779 family)